MIYQTKKFSVLLTASHCVVDIDNNELSVTCGGHFLNVTNNQMIEDGHNQDVRKILQHQQFSKK